VITGIMSGASLSGKQEDNRLKQVFFIPLGSLKNQFQNQFQNFIGIRYENHTSDSFYIK
jgi:hypothetical protein